MGAEMNLLRDKQPSTVPVVFKTFSRKVERKTGWERRLCNLSRNGETKSRDKLYVKLSGVIISREITMRVFTAT